MSGVVVPTPVSALGSLLAFINVCLIAFGIHLLTKAPSFELACWVAALTYIVSRRIETEPDGMLPRARAL